MSTTCSICGAEIESNDAFCSACGAPVGNMPASKVPKLAGSRVLAGVFTLALGALVALLGYFLGIVPLLALGIAALLLGVMILYLAEPGRIPSQLATSVTLPALVTIEKLLEELYFEAKGIYIPAGETGVSPKVFIPLTQTQLTDRPSAELARRGRLLVKVGEAPGELGIVIEAPGAEILSQVERLSGAGIAKTKFDELGGTLRDGFQSLHVGKNLVLQRVDDTVTVSLELLSLMDLESKVRTVAPRLFSQVGGPVESAVAAAVANVTRSYVTINQTELDLPKRRMRVVLGLKKMGSAGGGSTIGEQ